MKKFLLPVSRAQIAKDQIIPLCRKVLELHGTMNIPHNSSLPGEQRFETDREDDGLRAGEIAA